MFIVTAESNCITENSNDEIDLEGIDDEEIERVNVIFLYNRVSVIIIHIIYYYNLWLCCVFYLVVVD